METLNYHLTRWKETLERIFEDEPVNSQEIHRIKMNFQLETSEAFLGGVSLGLPSTEPDRTALLFSRLMHLFEFGLLMTSDQAGLRFVALFDHGSMRNLKPEIVNIPGFEILPYLKFLSPKSKSLQEKIRSFFPTLRPEDSVFLIRLSPQASMLFATTLAEPWLEVHLDKVLETLRKALLP